MATPVLYLQTNFVLNDHRRIVGTREPEPGGPVPLFTIIRDATSCIWAIRADIPDHLAVELGRLAQDEKPLSDFRVPPTHSDRYRALVGGFVSAGPAFEFPERIDRPVGVQTIEDEEPLIRHFRGWRRGEIAEGRSPVMGIVQDCHPVSICFCARRSGEAAEAGLETAEQYRGRGYGPRVAAAWALSVRASGRIPLYSTSWDNIASIEVARKLKLRMYACWWSLQDSQTSRGLLSRTFRARTEV